MIVGEASTTVQASPQQVIEFVLDLEADTAQEMVRFEELVDG